MDASRPSKKQRELLQFIDGFIKGYGYGPSYREIMRALNYKSVSTVATHVDNLISKGHLIKKDNSARSLAVTSPSVTIKDHVPASHTHVDLHKQWLLERTEMRIDSYNKKPDETKKQHVETLIDAVALLIGGEEAQSLRTKFPQA